MPSFIGIVLLAGALSAVHLFAGKLRFLRAVPRSWWLSAAGGISVAYVFVHLLPEITARQARLGIEAHAANTGVAVASEQALFLVVLVGFATFYGLEQFVRRSGREADGAAVTRGGEPKHPTSVFWIHVGSFATYNALVGYLLIHREETGDASLLLFGTAMAVHFVVNDHGLREHHRDAYDHVGRWVLSGSVLVGVILGALVGVPEPLLSFLFAFLAGGIVLNAIKEELPENRESQFWAFGAGTAAYTVVLLLV